jgi:hypothetical protein
MSMISPHRTRSIFENTVSTVSIVRRNDHEAGSIQPPSATVGADRDVSHRPMVTAADDADANAALHFR